MSLLIYDEKKYIRLVSGCVDLVNKQNEHLMLWVWRIFEILKRAFQLHVDLIVLTKCKISTVHTEEELSFKKESYEKKTGAEKCR